MTKRMTDERLAETDPLRWELYYEYDAGLKMAEELWQALKAEREAFNGLVGALRAQIDAWKDWGNDPNHPATHFPDSHTAAVLMSVADDLEKVVGQWGDSDPKRGDSPGAGGGKDG